MDLEELITQSYIFDLQNLKTIMLWSIFFKQKIMKGEFNLREPINFDFYYGKQADQFNFYRIPKLLFTDKRFSNVSIEAKVLYGLMLDRMSLSLRNGWIDEENRVYIYFKLEDAMEYMGIGKDKGVKLFAELDSEKGCGLIHKKKQGLGKPAIIYVMNFNSEVKSENKEDTDIEFQTSEKPKSAVCDSAEVLTSENPNSGLLENRTMDFGETEANNTKNNNTEFSSIYPIHHTVLNSSEEGQAALNVIDEIDKRKAYRKIICKNIDFNLLISIYSKESVCGVVDIMLDAVCYTGDFLKINANSVPQTVVKSQLLKLNHTHIGYVLECLRNNTTKVKNIRSYILTALYNSLSTLEHYYVAEVNHDLFGKTERSCEV